MAPIPNTLLACSLALIAPLVACAAASPSRSTSQAAPTVSEVQSSTSAGASSTASSVDPVASGVPSALPAASSASLAPEVPFPPAPIAPPHERSAQPGDGVWSEVPEAGAFGKGAVVRTTVRPHPINRFVFVYVVAMDLRKVDVRLAAGAKDPPSATIPAERRPGLVPDEARSRLLAVFNGGFQAKHGKHGVMVEGDSYLPAVDKLCTVAIRKDGGMRIGTWLSIKGDEASFRSYRQSPPCLLERGEVNPLVDAGDGARKYGMSIEGKMTIRRTAVGLDARGQTLLFGFGEDVTPRNLADAMKASGAVEAAELDINWSYTKFYFYGHDGPSPGVSLSLVPKAKYSKGAYVTDPASRDFFYATRKGTSAP